MKLPTIRGIIDRRILANFRVDPKILTAVIPAPFRPQLVGGFGIAGICLIRMKNLRPSFLPEIMGLSSENAAHRIAVEWDTETGTKTGVYVPRRDTSTLLNYLAGGRIFPGAQNHADFVIAETDTHFRVEMTSVDKEAHVLVDSLVADDIPKDSVFESLSEASKFFELGSLGFSPDREGENFEGLELRAKNWKCEPLEVTEVQSSFFERESVFPEGSVTFDNALLMRNIDHEWHGHEPICCS